MVRDLHAEPPPTRTAVREPERAPDADPSDLYMKDEGKERRQKERKPRNRKHGRPR
jgi:hypothetical protein